MQHTSPLLSYTRSFSFAGGATRANAGGTRAREHLSRALGEIDGLFAGMKYLDATEPLHTTVQPNSAPDDDLALELEALCRAASSRQPPPSQPVQDIAWSSVRDVREGMQCLWRHFVKVSQDLNMPIINGLRETYKDAKGLREAGVFAFRNTLTDPTPNDLENIFAFCSLSYVVSSLLHARGRFKKDDILAGVTLWQDALETQEEREAFKKLAQRLWPEAARNHLQFYDLGISPSVQQDMATLRRNHWGPDLATGTGQLPSSVAPSYTPEPSSNPASLSGFPDSGLQDPGFSTAEFETYGFFPTGAFTKEKAQAQVYKVTDATRREMRLYTCSAPPFDPSSLSPHPSYDGTGPTQFPDPNHGQLPNTGSEQCHDTGQAQYHLDMSWGQYPDTGQSQFPDTSYTQIHYTGHSQFPGQDYSAFSDPGLSAMPVLPPDVPEQPAASSAPDDASAFSDSPKGLRDTGTFAAVQEYCQENGNFWYDLSGWGMRSKDLRSLVKGIQQHAIQRQRIFDQYLRQLLFTKDKDVPSRGILSVAEAFVNMGYLRSVDEVKGYMIAIAKVSDFPT